MMISSEDETDTTEVLTEEASGIGSSNEKLTAPSCEEEAPACSMGAAAAPGSTTVVAPTTLLPRPAEEVHETIVHRRHDQETETSSGQSPDAVEGIDEGSPAKTKTIRDEDHSPAAPHDRAAPPAHDDPPTGSGAEDATGAIIISNQEVEEIVSRLLKNVTKALGACQDPSTVVWQQLDIAREGLRDELTSLVKLARPANSSEDVDIDTFGSLRSGLADGRSSDLDASVAFDGDEDVSPDRAKGLAETLSEQLRELDGGEKLFRVSSVLGAVVPLVKLEIFLENTTTSSEQFQQSTFPIDLSFNNRSGGLNTLWLRGQVQSDPRFRPLALQVKEFAKRIGLHGTFHGGSSSKGSSSFHGSSSCGGSFSSTDSGKLILSRGSRSISTTPTPEGSDSERDVKQSSPRTGSFSSAAEVLDKTVGLSSYGWSLLVAFFLHVHPAQRGKRLPTQDFLFSQFRKYFATFDYEKNIISFPGARVSPDEAQANQTIVSTSGGPVARDQWWQDFRVSVDQTDSAKYFRPWNPVLLDPFEARNLFRYFSHERNLENIVSQVVGGSQVGRRVFGQTPQAVHVFPWKLGTERIHFHLNCNGCDEEIDFELWGKSITHPADDPLLRLKLRVFEAYNKMFFDDDNPIVAGGGTVLQNVEDIVLAGGLYDRDNARNRRGLPVTVVSAPMENRRERIMETNSETTDRQTDHGDRQRTERKRIMGNVVRLIKGIKLILPLMNQTTPSSRSAPPPPEEIDAASISSGGGGADREEVTPEGSFEVGEVVEYNSVTHKQWMRTIVVGFPEDDPGHIHLSMRSSADRKRVRPLHGYSRETGGRDVVPWVVRVLSDTLALLPTVYGKHLSAESASVLSEAVSALKAVFDAGLVGANSVGAEFVIDLVTRKLTDLPRVPVRRKDLSRRREADVVGVCSVFLCSDVGAGGISSDIINLHRRCVETRFNPVSSRGGSFLLN